MRSANPVSRSSASVKHVMRRPETSVAGSPARIASTNAAGPWQIDETIFPCASNSLNRRFQRHRLREIEHSAVAARNVDRVVLEYVPGFDQHFRGL